MDHAGRLFMKAAGKTLGDPGDRLVYVVHRLVKGKAVKGDAGRALDSLVEEGALSPEAALYLGGFRQALNEIAQAVQD